MESSQQPSQMASRVLPTRRLSALLVCSVLLVPLITLIWWVSGSLQPKTPEMVGSGMALTQEIIEATSVMDSVVLTSGVYTPDSGMMLYSKRTGGDKQSVRVWATRLLATYEHQFNGLNSSQTLTWLIDYGDGAVDKEVITVPLNRVGDFSAYGYLSLPSLNSTAFTGANATIASVPPVADAPDVTAEVAQPPDVQVVESDDGGETAVSPDTDTQPDSSGDQSEADPLSNFLDPFDTDEPTAWNSFSGSWGIVDGTLQQTLPGAFDLGIASPFQGDNYTLTADIRYIDGEMGGGFYFNMSSRDGKAASQMVNFVQGGNAIQWGHFDEAGAFQFGGSTDIKNVADGAWHTLTLTVADGSADILLDDEIVAQNIPLANSEGYAGLLVSNSVVAFDNVAFTQNDSDDTLALSEPVEIDNLYRFDEAAVADWLPVAGQWQWQDGVYVQQQTNEFDRFSSLNLQMSGSYHFSTQLRYVEGEMGGGLIFNMQQRGAKNQAHMVSFAGEGTFLQWGTFDESGIFNYEGGVSVSNGQDGEWHELAVEVGEESYTIFLDGEAIEADLPLTYTGGFVGLFDGISWVEFDDVQLTGLGRSLTIAGESGATATVDEPDDTANESENDANDDGAIEADAPSNDAEAESTSEPPTGDLDFEQDDADAEGA